MVTEEQDSIVLSPERIEQESLLEWAAVFKLGTAGYRDQLDPEDIDNPKVAFNRTKVAVIAEAKARVYDRLFEDKGGRIERHVGGEVRPPSSSNWRPGSMPLTDTGFTFEEALKPPPSGTPLSVFFTTS